MSNIVYLSIYQTPEGHEYTHHDLFTTGKLSSVLGCGPKKYDLKSGSVSLVVAKSANPSDTKDIDLGLVKINNSISYNPWRDYGEFVCYDVDFIATKTIRYNDEGQASTINEGTLPNACDAIRHYNRGQVTTLPEGSKSNAGDR